MSNYQQVKDFRKRQKQRIIYVMGGKCSICGYNRCNKALELHHLDPEEKQFTFAQNTNRSWQSIVSELPKTILVCANCHREIHDNLIDNKTLKTSFDPNKEKEIFEEISFHKEGTQKFCKYCGKPISSKATLCMDCYAKVQRKVERPTREQLKNEIRTMPFVQIARKYQVTDNAIRKWCDSMNLPRTVTKIKTYSDEEWEKI